MSKAEERALEAYPYNRAYTDNDIEYDGNFCNRLPYIEGYEQAEEDLKLTWEDIQLIVSIDWDLDHEGFSCGKSTEEYYKEVLKQFNEERNNYNNN